MHALSCKYLTSAITLLPYSSACIRDYCKQLYNIRAHKCALKRISVGNDPYMCVQARRRMPATKQYYRLNLMRLMTSPKSHGLVCGRALSMWSLAIMPAAGYRHGLAQQALTLAAAMDVS